MESGALDTIRKSYQAALLKGHSEAAGSLLQKALILFGVTRLYLDLFGPALAHLGMLWCKGKINIAQEHLATQIVLNHLSKLRLTMRPRTRLEKRALITAVEGDQHVIGARMVADFLYFDGWEVDFLGASTPASSLCQFMKERRVDLVGLSSTYEQDSDMMVQAVEQIRSAFPDVLIVLGGQNVGRNQSHLTGLPATLITGRASDAVEEVRGLLGISKPKLSLEHYLDILGTRVQMLRKARGWSQQKLAEEALLDRTYISSVEHGKQNLTLSVALKLADALSVPLDMLLSQDFLETKPIPREVI